MVAFVSGNSLGLFNSSLDVLGTRGAVGNGGLGQSGEALYVNAATGNLVVQHQDELLVGLGPDVGLVRTYNSQGQKSDDNGDNWRLGLHKRLDRLTGAINTMGSTLCRTDGDGAELIYTYDSARQQYVNKDGAGSFDMLAYDASASSWTWTDGNSGVRETYDWVAGAGKLRSLIDLDGNALTYGYSGNLLTSVSDASGETCYLDYLDGNLMAIRAVSGDGTTLTRVRYGYDASNRLTSVMIDLTPQDNSIADGKVYTTSYTYDGASLRIAGITQSDGSAIGFIYAAQSDGSTRLTQITQPLNGGGRVTRLDYDLARRVTTVTDPLGNASLYGYDEQGRLINLQGPSIDGGRQSTSYSYDADGNVASQTDARSNSTSYQYDASGNQILQRDAAGNTIRRSYNGRNQLVSETVYMAPDPDGAGALQPGLPQTTRYAYDAANHLRFTVSAEGRVTEYRYNGQGQRVAAIAYAGTFYNVGALASEDTSPAEGTLSFWVAGVDKSRSVRTDSVYDFRGQLSASTHYAKVDVAGNGVLDGTESVTRYVYDQAGQLLVTVAPKGSATTGVANDFVTTHSYDGLGRLLSTSDAAGKLTVSQYDMIGNTIKTTLANGLATTSVYNQNGELISMTQAAGATALGTSLYSYDAAGRLSMTQDPQGARCHFLYDEAGRKIAEMDQNGGLTEYRYNAGDQLIQTIRYATVVATAGLLDENGNLANISLSAIRPAAASGDRISRNIYDAANRLVKSIDELGYVTERLYDGASRVTEVIRYATAVDAGAIGVATQAGDATATPARDALNDRRTRTLYDNDGNVLATWCIPSAMPRRARAPTSEAAR